MNFRNKFLKLISPQNFHNKFPRHFSPTISSKKITPRSFTNKIHQYISPINSPKNFSYQIYQQISTRNLPYNFSELPQRILSKKFVKKSSLKLFNKKAVHKIFPINVSRNYRRLNSFTTRISFLPDFLAAWIFSPPEFPHCPNFLATWISLLPEFPRCPNFLAGWIP